MILYILSASFHLEILSGIKKNLKNMKRYVILKKKNQLSICFSVVGSGSQLYVI